MGAEVSTMNRIVVTMAPTPLGTSVLAMDGQQELLRAVLGPAEGAHPKAAPTLLEGLSLWHQRPLHVVLYVKKPWSGSFPELLGPLGFGQDGLYYDVGVVTELDQQNTRPRRLGGLGNFRLLRRIAGEVDR